MDPQISAGYYGQSTLFQRCRYYTNRLLVDADSAGNVDIKRSTIGYVYTLGGTVVSWGSQLQKMVALSTTEADHMSLLQKLAKTVTIDKLKLCLASVGLK